MDSAVISASERSPGEEEVPSEPFAARAHRASVASVASVADL